MLVLICFFWVKLSSFSRPLLCILSPYFILHSSYTYFTQLVTYTLRSDCACRLLACVLLLWRQIQVCYSPWFTPPLYFVFLFLIILHLILVCKQKKWGEAWIPSLYMCSHFLFLDMDTVARAGKSYHQLAFTKHHGKKYCKTDNYCKSKLGNVTSLKLGKIVHNKDQVL